MSTITYFKHHYYNKYNEQPIKNKEIKISQFCRHLVLSDHQSGLLSQFLIKATRKPVKQPPADPDHQQDFPPLTVWVFLSSVPNSMYLETRPVKPVHVCTLNWFHSGTDFSNSSDCVTALVSDTAVSRPSVTTVSHFYWTKIKQHGGTPVWVWLITPTHCSVKWSC